jgi:periplasmic divalent cation tolerance protein
MIPAPFENGDPMFAMTTVGTREEANRMAHGLVDSRLCACVSVMTGVESTYRWEGRIRTEPEVLLLIKTRREHLEAVRKWILAHHPYELPEFLVCTVESGDPRYLAWLRDETRIPTPEDP